MKHAFKTLLLVNSFVAASLVVFYLTMVGMRAYADDTSSDGIVAVISTPVDVAIDVAFAALGYNSQDGDDDE